MSYKSDDPAIEGWAAPTFSVPLSGTMQKLPLKVRCNFPLNRNGKWKANIYNPEFKREIPGTHDGYYYEFTIDDLDQGPDCEIHTQFDAQGAWSEWGFSGKFRVIKALTLTAPPTLLGPAPVISGVGAYPNAEIQLYQLPTGRTWSGVASADGSWSVRTEGLGEGRYTVGAIQIVASVRSPESNGVTFTIAKAPKITSPVNDAVLVNERMPMISGDGHDGTEILIYESGSGAQLYGRGVVANSRFQVKLTVALPFRKIVLVAESRHSNQFLQWSNEVSVTVVDFGIPIIQTPATGAYVSRTPLFQGEGTVGAAVIVYRDYTTEVVGGTIVGADKKWSTYASQLLSPGSFTIVAEQVFQGQLSGRSTPRSFKVRPPTLTSVNVAYPTLTSAAFSGAGHTGATIEITIINGPAGATAPPAVTVSAGSWSTTSQNWPIGEYDLKAIQKVSDNAGGWILSQEYLFKASTTLAPPTEVEYSVVSYTPTFSGKGVVGASVEVTDKADGSPVAPAATVNAQGDWSTRALQAWTPGSIRTICVVQKVGAAASQAVELTINIDRIPSPTNVEYTVDGYTPTFLGNGISGATVQLLDDGGGSSAVPDAHVVNQQWSSRAQTPWGPTHERNVNIRQGLNNDWSEGWVVLVVTIPLLAPVVRVADDGLSPVVSGTCLPGAVLMLKYSDSAVEHRPVNTNGNWTFKRPGEFDPGIEHTVTVTQSFAGRLSPPASQNFFVSPNKLLISEPSENQEVGYNMVVRGRAGYSGATVRIRDAQFGRPLGEPKVLLSHGDWFIELEKLEFRKYQIDATQTIDGRESSRSDVRSYWVVLLPPVIEVPAANQALARTATISGTGEPFGLVTVWRNDVSDPLLVNVPVNAQGRWSSEVTLPVGTYTLRSSQSFDTQKSKDSPPRTYKVVPAAPFIESPGKDAHVGRSVVVSGFGYPGDTVTVTLSGRANNVPGRSPVLEDRTWSLLLELTEAAGDSHLVAVASRDGFDSAGSTAHPVMPGLYLPGIDEPAAGRWVEDPVNFAGTGRAGVGRVVSWYNPEEHLSANIPVTAQGWQSKATLTLRNGGQWCRFQQTIIDGADGQKFSDWIESARFEKYPAPFNWLHFR